MQRCAKMQTVGFLILMVTFLLNLGGHLNFAVMGMSMEEGETTSTNMKTNFVCPTPEEIAPCSCDPGQPSRSPSISVNCAGSEVTQEILLKTMTALRLVNHLEASRWLHLRALDVTQTTITELDLTPIYMTAIENLAIWNNPNLVRIFGSSNSDQSQMHNQGLIETKNLSLYENCLDNEGLSTTLRHFVPTTLKELELDSNKIEGSQYPLTDGSGDIEFLPGLSAFIHLEYLNLERNRIRRLGGGQFKRLKHMSVLCLQHNEIEEIGENAFAFDEPEEPMIFEDLTIYLYDDGLEDKSFHPMAMAGRIRPTTLFLSGNKFRYISAEKFDPFLQSNPENILYFGDGNQFKCDEKMKWLREQRGEMHIRVFNISCTNDPGHTIFNTKLIF